MIFIVLFFDYFKNDTTEVRLFDKTTKNLKFLNERFHNDPIFKKAENFHNSLSFIADLHADTLLWSYRGSLFKKNSHFHVDIPKMQEGNQALQTFSSVVQYPFHFKGAFNGGVYKQHFTNDSDIVGLMVLYPQFILHQKFINFFKISTYSKIYKLLTSYSERVKFYSQNLQKNENLLQNYEIINGKKFKIFHFIKTKNDFKTFLNKRKTISKKITAGLFSFEGTFALDNQVSKVQELYNYGIRMAGLSHFSDTKFGSTNVGVGQFSKIGFIDKSYAKSVVDELVRLNIIIDFAHCSSFLIDDVLSLLPKYENNDNKHYPIVISHAGVKGVCNSSRNVDDEHIIKICKRKGLIGVGLFKGSTCGETLQSTVDTIKYIKNLIGDVNCISLGSDWDGLVSTHIQPNSLKYLTFQLMKNGFSKNEIRKIMGDNYKNFLLKHLP